MSIIAPNSVSASDPPRYRRAVVPRRGIARKCTGPVPGRRPRKSPPVSAGSVRMGSPPDRCARICPPEYLGAEHTNQVHQYKIENHGLGGRRPHAHRAAAGVIAVVAGYKHDRRGLRQPLDEAEQEVREVLELPEEQEVTTRRRVSDLLHDREKG